VHRMHVPRKHCVYMSSPGEPGHTHGTHTRHGRTRAHGCTDHTDETHNHPNPPTLHQRTHTHDDRNRGRLYSAAPISTFRVFGGPRSQIGPTSLTVTAASVSAVVCHE
jgi:hypothetical protein